MNAYLRLENAVGMIEMGGQSSDLWRVIAVTGLTSPEADTQVKTYVRIPGQRVLDTRLLARTIIIHGSLNTRDKAQRQFCLTRAAQIFDASRTLTLRCNFTGKLRRVSVRPVTFDVSHYNAAGQEFTLSLIADNPYFRDWEDSRVSLFSRTDNLIDSMTFPRVFTLRTTGGVAVNNGLVDVEPVIVITAGDPGEGTESGLTITNTTTGAQIVLNYAPSAGEVITIDIAGRSITSSTGGNILNHKSKDTLLGGFVLVPGQNAIAFENANTGQPITASLIYSSLYTEAVY